ncbi:MAG: SPOR domain-containing protein [Alphaproteobacteria bacterium]|nr:SPOR domain-containing protein [Alphaproteobacteria bacterium]
MSTARSSLALILAAILGWGAAARAETPQFWVQIAAAANEAKANARLREIAQHNGTVRQAQEAGRILVYKQEDKRGDLWRVRIGPFDTHELARRYCGQLRNEGQSCLAVR